MEREPFIKGDDIDLYPVEKEDLGRLRNIVNHPDVRIPLGYRKPFNMGDEEEWYQQKLNDDTRVPLTIYHKSDERIIGNIELKIRDVKSRVAEIGFHIDKRYHSNSIGTEFTKLALEYGFKQLNLHKIWARVYEFNEKSLGLLKKLGFQQEGELREQAYMKGKYVDKIRLGLLKKEWQNKTNNQ